MFIFSNADGTTAAGRFLYSNLCIESLRQCRQFQSCKPIRKTATSHAKQKRYSFHPYRLMFIFCQRRQHGCHMAFSLLEFVHRIAPPMRINSHHAILSEKLLHSRKAKRYSFHPYRLTFIFSQHRRHDCHMAFSLPESVHRIAPPASSLFGKLLHPRKTKAAGLLPYRLMFIFSNADGTAATWRFLYSNLCIELFRQRQAYQAAASHTKQSGTVFTHTA